MTNKGTERVILFVAILFLIVQISGLLYIPNWVTIPLFFVTGWLIANAV